ncbi:transposase, partial [Enterocloster citroniae]|nr:transposase [Enterocloster citroniae]
MAKKYTEDQLNTLDKSFLVQMYLSLQEQLESLTKETHELNEKMQLMMEQLILNKQARFGRSSEKMTDAGQICFKEVDGNILFFNEAEAISNMAIPE